MHAAINTKLFTPRPLRPQLNKRTCIRPRLKRAHLQNDYPIAFLFGGAHILVERIFGQVGIRVRFQMGLFFAIG